MPAESYEALPKELGDFFRTVRAPVNGPKLVIDENYFVEVALPSFISRDLDQAAHDYYRQPFLEKSSRKPASRRIKRWSTPTGPVGSWFPMAALTGSHPHDIAPSENTMAGVAARSSPEAAWRRWCLCGSFLVRTVSIQDQP